MEIKATLETRRNKEDKFYDVVVLKLSENSEKLVFLSPAELELLRISYSKESSSDTPSFLG